MAAGLFSYKMNPMIGAAAMSLSSFTVCMNALRLNLFNIHDTKHDKAPKDQIDLEIETERKDNMEKTLKIEGMMCEHCEANVKKALEALDFIEEARPSHTENNCVITVCGEFDEAAVKQAIEAKDYQYNGVE